jgi:trehalose/maltose hydrolase-like predicted phosphorylase
MVTLSPHNQDIDAGIPARGLHGEAYRGHIFWDELFILPFYYINFKEVARSVLIYRYRRLDAARRYALEHGFRGAMFPWQSGSDGREETQVMHLNPVSGEWGPDHSALQRHVSLAIAYNTWMYYWISGDRRFMEDYGAELLFEICRFWVSKSNLEPLSGRYSISGVMGPDEFHEHSPGSDEGGLRDNAYTNIMVAWMLEKAFILMESLPAVTMRKVYGKIGLSQEETSQWRSVAAGLRLVISPEGIIAQYDGYFGLKELDWQAYRAKYGNIYRMDRLLKAEGRSPDEFKVAKQADTLMTFYNLEKPEADRILSRLGYSLPEDYLQRNLRYYLDRTSHGSTLSRVVHARLANLAGDAGLGWRLYLDALTSDYQDIQGGTTAEGIHAGVMAGTVWIAINTFGGLDLSEDHPSFDPRLPDHWRSLSFGFDFRGAGYECELSYGSLRIRAEGEGSGFRITVQGHEHWIRSNEWAEIPLSPLQPS